MDSVGGVGDKPIGDRDSDAHLPSSLFVDQAHLFLKHQNQVHLFFKHENQACLFLAVGHQDLFTSVLGSGAIKFEKSEERLQHLEAHKFLELFELPDPIRKPNDPLEPLDLDLETLDL